MKKQNWFARVLVGIAVVVMVALIGWQISKRTLKQQILSEVLHSNGGEVWIDLGNLSSEEILRVCIQFPYMTKERAEKQIAAPLKDFDMIDDKYFILWIVKKNGDPEKIKFQRWNELDLSRDTKGCISGSKINIVNTEIKLNEEN